MAAVLVPPSPKYAVSCIAAMREGFARGIRLPASEARIREIAADVARHIAQITEQRGTITLPNGEVVPKVPFSLFWLVEGDAFIGEISIRHEVHDWLLQEGGHIGYGIRPSRRGQGYGKLILRLGLDECRRLALLRVLVTCADDNPASAWIIEANGDELENISPTPPALATRPCAATG